MYSALFAGRSFPLYDGIPVYILLHRNIHTFYTFHLKNRSQTSLYYAYAVYAAAAHKLIIRSAADLILLYQIVFVNSSSKLPTNCAITAALV